MFRHVVLFTWQEGTTQQQVEKVAAELRALPGIISEVRAYHVGPDVGINPGNADFAVVADFDAWRTTWCTGTTRRTERSSPSTSSR